MAGAIIKNWLEHFRTKSLEMVGDAKLRALNQKLQAMPNILPVQGEWATLPDHNIHFRLRRR